MEAISLFCGCGGSDLGLQRAGVNVKWATDKWSAATEVYKLNFPSVAVVTADVAKIEKFPTADLVVGCYPCQGFSQGGKRDPTDERNFLYRDFARCLGQVKPKAFIVENVVGMTFGRNRKTLDNQVALFRRRGYSVTWKLLDARDYGLAQERKRVFIVGTRKDLDVTYRFPKPTHGEKSGTAWVGQEEVLRGFPTWPAFDCVDDPFTWYYLSRPRRREWDQPAPCIVGHYRSVPLHPISPELEYIGPDEYRFANDSAARRYSLKECAALQGFPSDFNWGTRNLITKYRLVGNAVPPPLMELVCRPVHALLRD